MLTRIFNSLGVEAGMTSHTERVVLALGKVVAAESLSRAGVNPEQVGEVIVGNVLQAGQGMNPARQVSLGIGIPQAVPAWTVNMVVITSYSIHYTKLYDSRWSGFFPSRTWTLAPMPSLHCIIL